MRVRPFFWFLLAFTCMSILLFASLYRSHAPAILQVYVAQQHPVASESTTLELRLTDQQGIPIEEAQVSSKAWMTNMDMLTREIHIKGVGHGHYMVRLHLYMTGPWAITIMANADGFAPLQETLSVQVE